MAHSGLPVTVIVTCEHASVDVPAELRGLGLPIAVLQSHAGFDVGAVAVARAVARAVGVKPHLGRWSRLVADLNRSADHPRVIARRTGGRVIPGNAGLTPGERAARLARYWRSYRDDVAADVAAAVARGICLHLSVHSFVERLGGIERKNEVGLLYDHRRIRERAVVDDLRTALLAERLSVRRNFPYFGHTDGLTSHLRSRHPASRYLGVEIELNQREARTAAGVHRFAEVFARAVPALPILSL